MIFRIICFSFGPDFLLLCLYCLFLKKFGYNVLKNQRYLSIAIGRRITFLPSVFSQICMLNALFSYMLVTVNPAPSNYPSDALPSDLYIFVLRQSRTNLTFCDVFPAWHPLRFAISGIHYKLMSIETAEDRGKAACVFDWLYFGTLWHTWINISNLCHSQIFSVNRI